MTPIEAGREQVRKFLEYERDIAAMALRVSRELSAYCSIERERRRRDLLNDELDEIYFGRKE
jgi:hypothetical protein